MSSYCPVINYYFLLSMFKVLSIFVDSICFKYVQLCIVSEKKSQL